MRRCLLLLALFLNAVAAQAVPFAHTFEPTDPLVVALRQRLPPEIRSLLKDFRLIRCDYTEREARLAFWGNQQSYKDTLALYRFHRGGGEWRLDGGKVVTLYDSSASDADDERGPDYVLPETLRLQGEPYSPLDGPDEDVSVISSLIEEDAEYNRGKDGTQAYARFEGVLEESFRTRLQPNALAELRRAADDYFSAADAALEKVEILENQLAKDELNLTRTQSLLAERVNLESRIAVLEEQLAAAEELLARSDPEILALYREWKAGNSRTSKPIPGSLPIFQDARELKRLREALSKLPLPAQLKSDWMRREMTRADLSWSRLRHAEYRQLAPLSALLLPRSMATSMEMRGRVHRARELLSAQFAETRELIETYEGLFEPSQLPLPLAELRRDEIIANYFDRQRSRYELHLEWLKLQINRFDYTSERLLAEIEMPRSR